MHARIRFEHEAEARLRDEGYACMRSAGSRGPFDLVAFSGVDVRLIQVKSTRALNRPGNVTVFADAILPLLALPIPPAHASRWLFVKVLRGAWYRLQVDGYSLERATLLNQVRGVLQVWRDGENNLVHRWRDRQRVPDVRAV